MTDTIYAWSRTAADNSSTDTTVNWAEFQTPSSVNDSARAMMARIAALISDMAPARSSTGSANAYVVDSDAAGSSFRNGEQITFIPHATNTGACTLNVDGRGAKPWRPAPSTSFDAGNILEGVPVTAYYRLSTDEWLSPGTGYYVTNLAEGISLQAITARMPQIGDLVVSFSPTPGAGRIRLTETSQSVLKTSYPELNSYLSSISYPWGSTATHFTLPPAAGYFLRFAPTTSAIDTAGARAAGVTQSDTNKTASVPATGLTAASTSISTSTGAVTGGVFGGAATASWSSSGSGVSGPTVPTAISVGVTTLTTTTTTVGGAATLPGADEVRTKNVAFHCDVVASSAQAAAVVGMYGFPYRWDTTTSAGDPGTGRIRGNSATLSAITAIYISQEDYWGVDLSTVIGGWSALTDLSISVAGAQSTRIVCSITGAPVDNGNYYTLPVTVTASAGTMTNSAFVGVEYMQTGADGVTVPDLSGLTEDTANNDATDWLIEYDASASLHKKVLPRNLGFTPAGTGAYLRPLRGKLDERGISILDFIPPALHAGIRAGTDTTDLATYLAAARTHVGTLNQPACIFFPSGKYTTSLSPNWCLSHLELATEGEVVWSYTGTGNAFIVDGGAFPASGAINMRVGRFRIEGTSSTQNGVYVRCIHHSWFDGFNIRNVGTAYAGLLIEFAVCTVFNKVICSNNHGAFTSAPSYGVKCDQRSANEATAYCIFYDPILEGLQVGMFMKVAVGSLVYGGTMEGCSFQGLLLDTTAVYNKIYSCDYEVNTQDIYCAGDYNSFIDCDTTTTIILDPSSNGNVIQGGIQKQITIQAGATRNCVFFTRYNWDSSGATISDAGTSTRLFMNLDMGAGGIWSRITAENIQDNAVTYAKIQYVSENHLLGRVSSGAGVVQELPASNVRSILSVREQLTAARTYYVRTDGSDSNTGLANTAGGAFLTLQKAIDVAAGLDTSVYDVTIQLATGSYPTSTGIIAKQTVGAGSIIVVGDETTPSNVVLTTNGAMTNSDGCILVKNVGTTYKWHGLKFTSTASGTVFGLYASSNVYTEFKNCDFGSGITQQVRAEDGGIVKATGNYSITAGASTHISVVGSGIARIQSVTVTLTGTPAFSSAFVDLSRVGVAFLNGNTFSGSATGSRYAVAENSVVYTAGGGATYLPGDAAGSTATGGQYL